MDSRNLRDLNPKFRPGRFLKPLALMLSSGAFSAAVSAQILPNSTPGDAGFFYGIHGGVSSLQDQNNSTTGALPAPRTVPDPNVCLVPPQVLPFALPCLQQDTMTVQDPAPQQVSRTSFKNGESYGLSFGYGYANGIRPEISLDYRSNDVRSQFLSTGYGAGIDGSTLGTSALSGGTTAVSVMANLYFDFDNATRFLPHMLLGLGLARIKTDIQSADGLADNDIKGDDRVFSYQAGLGLGYKVSPNTLVSLDYRFFKTRNPSYPNSARPEFEIDSGYRSDSAILSLQYFPKTDALFLGLKDADGDGTPDNQDKCPDTPANVAVGADGCPLDTDGDGVPDYLDKCPDTPAGVKVSADGCPADADNDGTPDENDKCPDTPAGVAVGPDGCPLDSDGDGVSDDQDKCPDTPIGIAVDLNGCPPDSDGDGVPDSLDKCADTPAGQKVGPDGCALDSDGDGVPDYLDECPNSPAGAKVLANGCALKGDCRTPRPGEQVDANGCAVDQSFILKGVNFEFDSDRLTPEAQLILNQVAETLKAYPDVKVEIAGHTDNLGTDTYNLGLSEKRAISVKNYLSGREVDVGRMSPNGYGETQPIADNADEAGQSQNRRVELRVIEE